MKPHAFTTRLMVLVLLAGLGLALIVMPPKLVDIYRTAQEIGPWLGWTYLIAVATGAALLGGATLWILIGTWRRTRRKRARREQGAKNPSQLTAHEQQAEVDENLTAAADLSSQQDLAPEVRSRLAHLAGQLEEKRERDQLEIVAFGTVSSGKSSLLNALAGKDVFPMDARGGTTVRRSEIPWPNMERVSLVDTPGLGEIDGAERVRVAAESAKDADVILVVVDGPLRESEHQLLEQLGQMEKRVLLCLNKEDWYSESDREKLLGQIRQQARGFVLDGDVLAVRSRPTERERVRILANGDEVRETATVAADISTLAKRMLDVVQRDGRQLLMANLLLQSRGLLDDARVQVQESLDRQAWEIVERHTWGAGGAAALSPLPLVDLLAGGAISAKMVVELSRVYRQEMDSESAINLLGQLGKNLIAVLGVSAATPAVAAGIGSLLKTVPGAGTIAGGLLQGGVQALVTRWIGAVFIGYFKDELVRENKSALASLARREWDRLTSLAELRRFMAEARQQLAARRDAGALRANGGGRSERLESPGAKSPELPEKGRSELQD